MSARLNPQHFVSRRVPVNSRHHLENGQEGEKIKRSQKVRQGGQRYPPALVYGATVADWNLVFGQNWADDAVFHEKINVSWLIKGVGVCCERIWDWKGISDKGIDLWMLSGVELVFLYGLVMCW